VIFLRFESEVASAFPSINCERGSNGSLRIPVSATERPPVFSADPFVRVVAAIEQHVCRVRWKSPDKVRAICPAHRDRDPSLAVTRKGDRVLVHCFGGCSPAKVVASIGLTMADLFSGPPDRQQARPTISATYDYTDLSGKVLARKVRLVPKQFRWQTPDHLKPNAFRWGLHDVTVGLYNLPALIDARQVLVTEGERAVDRLTALAFAATCPPGGASVWRGQWSEDLWRLGCVEAVVLVDADMAGRRHAERVARACFELRTAQMATGTDGGRLDPKDQSTGDRSLQVKLVTFPCIPGGGDVVDFLDAGNTAADLRALIAAAPFWSPDLEHRRRSERRRANATARQRKRRARLKMEREALSRSVCQDVSPITFGPPRHTPYVRLAPVTLSRRHAPERSS